MKTEDRYLTVAIVCFIALLFFLWNVKFAVAHDHNRPELNEWFKSLHSKGGAPCCDGSDATRLDDVDWDVKDGHYRVRLNGRWVDVPDHAIVEGPNKAGPTMVWPFYMDGELTGIRCFQPGGGV